VTGLRRIAIEYNKVLRERQGSVAEAGTAALAGEFPGIAAKIFFLFAGFSG